MEIIQERLSIPFGELGLYYSFAEKINLGLKPYIDFFPEYPPFALYLFRLANIFGVEWFTLMWYLMVFIATVFIAYLIKKLNGNFYIYLACILPLGGLYWDRFDVFPSMFALLSVYLAKKENISSFVSLFIGIMIKIYPIILLPVILGMFFVKNIKKMIFGLSLFILLLIVTPKDFIKNMFSYHGHRGIQIESIRAIPLLFKDSVVEWKHGTYEIK